MIYPRELFSLQLDFAKEVARLKNIELKDTLLDYTFLYKIIGISGWDFDSHNPIWQEFIQNVSSTDNLLDYVYSFYQKHHLTEKHSDNFGCFSYEIESDKNEKWVQIHFHNTDFPNSPFKEEKIATRKAELTTMFSEVKKQHPDVKDVFGFSWLYNTNSYRRLFPPQFTKNPKIVKNWFRSLGLWGQFLNSAGEIKKEMADQFLTCLKKQNSFDKLIDCFPYKVLEPHGKLRFFFDYYSI